jgi:hypothetical protein
MRHGTVWSLAATVLLCACQPNAGATTASQLPSATHKNQGNTTSSPNEKSTLSSVLAMFASDDGRQWSAYASVPGITWFDNSPREFREGKYDRGGRLLLTGFGTAKLPNGKTGMDYDVVNGNEGQAGLTLVGDSHRVEALSVSKFYFSRNYLEILKRQFSAGETVQRIALACAPVEEDGVAANTEFLKVLFADGRVVFVEAHTEAGGKYSPGSTVFDFQQKEPLQKIKELGCQRS